MKKKINKSSLNLKQKSNVTKIKTDLKETNYDSRRGKLAFEFASDNKCCLSEWHNRELKLLIDSFKKIERLTWNEVFNDTGLNWERNKNIAIQLPTNIPKDVKLYSFRVNGKMRVYGYRAQEFFYIIWFDRNHIICPKNKPKNYSA